MRYPFIFRTLVPLGMLLIVALPANAQDISIGGDSRIYAMAGAGLALPPESGSVRVNPASLGVRERNFFDVSFPAVGVRTGGSIRPDRVQKFAQTLVKSSSFNSNTLSLLKSYTARDSELGFNLSEGVRFGSFEVSAFGAGRGRLLPNAILQSYAQRLNINQLDANAIPPPGSRSDIIALGYTALPAISFGAPLGVKTVRAAATCFAWGARAKFLSSYYTHIYADDAQLRGDNTVNLNIKHAAELGESRNYLRKNGFGGDIGFLASPGTGNGFSSALLVTNIIQPSITFQGTDRNGNPKEYKPFATTLSSGIGYTVPRYNLAADMVDITSSVDKADLRFGGEYHITDKLNLRGGYSSTTGFTIGAGFGGIGVALGKRQPLEISKSLRF